MTQKEKAKLVPVSREPALLTERDADKSPVLECIDLGITFGGLKVNTNANVVNGDGDAIPGLFAAGETVGVYYGNYTGATRLTTDYAQAGDIVQYENIDYPTSWVSGVHTLLIVGVNGDGTFDIVQSNVPGGSGLVTEVKN